MRALAVALTLFAGPASGPSGAVAIQWRGAEAPDDPLRLAVREAVAGLDGRPLATVPDRALDRARVAVSREHPVAIRELRGSVRATLDEADAAYREGRFADARTLLDELLASLRANPTIPGAAASAREAHLLAARIAWAGGDAALAEQALADALRLDPEATLAAKRAPPELVERYRSLQTRLLATRDSDWIEPRVTIDGEAPAADVTVEIDGVPGLRRVPPGAHFVVVVRDGREPVAAWRELDLEWAVPAAAERVSSDPDVEHEAICRALALELLIVAERRGPRIGLEGYRCGAGFGPRWSGNREALADGVALVVAGPFEAASSSLADAWPPPTPEVIEPPGGDGPIDTPRPWYRKGWIWGTSVGVAAAIAGGVAAGVLLGGREPAPSLVIDADSFLRP